MAIAKRLGCLSWISLHKHRIRMWQAHHEEVDLAFHATDHAQRLTKINLRMARPMRQRHKHLFGAPFLLAHVIGHRGQAASISMLIAQPFKDALGRVSLLFDQGFVCAQYLIDHTNITIKRWPPRRFRPTIPRRKFMAQHLRDRLTIFVL